MKVRKNTLVFISICALIIGLANSGLHPVSGSSGYTGAPGDSTCAECHSGGNSNLNGEILIDGLPSTIITGETYTIFVTVTNPNGNALRGGFQLVALNGTNGNAGSMANNSADTQIRTVSGGKRYFGHAPAPSFPGSNTLSFNVDWTAPSTTGSNPVIKFYASAVIANGNGSSSNDRVVLTNQIIPITTGASPLSVSISNVNPASCANSNNGSATATPSGGVSPYSYLWNNGVNSATNNSLFPGLAVVTVTDNTGNTATATANISSPPAVVATAFGSIICLGATNGSASAIASGGTGGFTYQWSNGATGSNISNLITGSYIVTVSDNSNCTATAVAFVNLSPQININGNITNVRCNNQSNGIITTSITGGTIPLNYLWSTGATQSSISGLIAGNYTITVTDAAFCTNTRSFTATQPQPLITTTSVNNNVTCNGGSNGSATVTASGGTPSYSYHWSNGATGTGNSSTQSNLAAGTYTITVTDILDCQSTGTVVINQPSAIIINAQNIRNITCHGMNDGLISVTASGNSGIVSYLWSNGATTSTVNNLSAATYAVTVTDSGNGCTKSASFVITEPSPLVISALTSENVSCNGGMDGSIGASVAGGTVPYTYLWNNNLTTSNIVNLREGTYTVTVSDVNNCTISQNKTITQPEPIIISLISSNNANCVGANNGSLEVTAAHGTAPYTYQWSNGTTGAANNNITAGKYYVTATDHLLCTVLDSFTVGSNTSFSIELLTITDVLCHGDSTGTASVTNNNLYSYQWSNGATTSSVSHLPAGIFSAIAVDGAGCQSTPLIVSITEPLKIKALLLESDTILCPADSNGYLSVRLTGGTGNLSFQWSNHDKTLLPDSLIAGIYTISITDENSCKVSNSFKVHQADSIIIDAVHITPVTCNGLRDGKIELSVNGGFGILDYNWPTDTIARDSIYGLSSGNYFLTITDIGGCNIRDSFYVHQPDLLTSVASIKNETESGANDGSVLLTISGGTAPYEISWSNGSAGSYVENLSPGIYFFGVKDNNQCSEVGWVTIGGGNCGITANVSLVQPICFNSYDGQIILNINGNFPKYNIELYNQKSRVNYRLDSLPADTYTVLITDSLQCATVIPGIILKSEHPAILINQSIINLPSGASASNGSISVEATGGIGNLRYEWYKNDNLISATTSSINNLSSGIYTLHVIDDTGCILVSNDFVLTITGTENTDLYPAVMITPNPVFSNINIRSTSGLPLQKIEIFDINGRLIYVESYSGAETERILEADLIGMLFSGIYYTRVHTKGKITDKKLVFLK